MVTVNINKPLRLGVMVLPLGPTALISRIHLDRTFARHRFLYKKNIIGIREMIFKLTSRNILDFPKPVENQCKQL